MPNIAYGVDLLPTDRDVNFLLAGCTSMAMVMVFASGVVVYRTDRDVNFLRMGNTIIRI